MIACTFTVIENPKIVLRVLGWVYPDVHKRQRGCLPSPGWLTLRPPLFTVKWKATVTPSGNGTLSCHYKKKWEFQCEDYGNCAVEP